MLLQFPRLSLSACTKGYLFLSFPYGEKQEGAESGQQRTRLPIHLEELEPCERARQAARDAAAALLPLEK